ncbi:hypothetical protein BO94DRAFT_387379 [Aspergillus sclerotioniger CBS 115572]|uniref:Uncharacterized protein n=1 Tax=Aspergillus sclerotioniger CBS 115572 TaxID=1450535 RepID=A0A317WY69_9EURO|nr:hypothetical protein BO94DRAFT_387379 [Aspergillus sclerotioniger CBS 115572]PWY91299.1 hypothetical protein BO94DRAFT_387379 [Aspergillus sclerotioniger CBS 115572]
MLVTIPNRKATTMYLVGMQWTQTNNHPNMHIAYLLATAVGLGFPYKADDDDDPSQTRHSVLLALLPATPCSCRWEGRYFVDLYFSFFFFLIFLVGVLCTYIVRGLSHIIFFVEWEWEYK